MLLLALLASCAGAAEPPPRFSLPLYVHRTPEPPREYVKRMLLLLVSTTAAAGLRYCSSPALPPTCYHCCCCCCGCCCYYYQSLSLTRLASLRYFVVGERNSGTNWLHTMLENNVAPGGLVPAASSPFWKHSLVNSELYRAVPPSVANSTLFVVLVKDPYVHRPNCPVARTKKRNRTKPVRCVLAFPLTHALPHSGTRGSCRCKSARTTAAGGPTTSPSGTL